MVNWMPTTLGPMYIAPGLEYIGQIVNNLPCNPIAFIASTIGGAALLELTGTKLRVWLDDVLLQRPAVSTATVNGDFALSASWTDASTSGGTATFGAGLTLNAVNIGGNAIVRQAVTVAAGDRGIEHALRIVVARGPVLFRAGQSAGSDNFIQETYLREGEHSLALTPNSNFIIEFETNENVDRKVTSVQIESSGNVSLTAPWSTADLSILHYTQSVDVMFVAIDGKQQYRIERRDSRSWSVVKYYANDGPFLGPTQNIRLKLGQTYGNTTLTASKPFFKQTHVGALIRVFNSGQRATFKLGADETFTEPIRVSGVTGETSNDRDWSYTISGTWAGTLRVQRSFDGPDVGFQDYPLDFEDGTDKDITSNVTHTNGDKDDNAIIWYRIGFPTGMYISGTATVSFDYDGGGGYAIVRIVGFTNSTTVDVEVLKSGWGTAYTRDWSEGSWSQRRGFPTATVLYEGRLWWFSGALLQGSISDAYDSFNQEQLGDAGPIIRSLGEGPVDAINFALALKRLVIGTTGAELSVKSSNFEEPLTPSNLTIKPTSNQGSQTLTRAVAADGRGVFVQRSGSRIYELVFDGSSLDYAANDLTILHPDLLASGVVDIAIQRQPDTRIHVVMGNGKVAVLTYEPSEDLICWSRIETDGVIERAAVLPGTDEDQVYYVVKRTVNGSDVRYLEKVALRSECIGGTVCKLAHSLVTFSQTASTTVSGFTHLVGEYVIVWADGAALVDSDGNPTLHLVSGAGQITTATAVAVGMAGLPYEARYKSTKLAYAAAQGTPLNMQKRVDHLGIIARNMHHNALRFGRDYDHLDPLRQVFEAAVTAAGTIHDDFDEPLTEFPGEWDTDSRLCLKGQAPFPVELLAATLSIETHG